jgi:hypothetical protein
VKKLRLMVIATIVFIAWLFFSHPNQTSVSLHIQQPFHEVVTDSTFPVMASSNIPDASTDGSGATWITEPAVVIRFNDPEHGFTLPPTTFAGISYSDYRVSTIETSPMLKKLSFRETVELVDSLQRQFQTGGWLPHDNQSWIDVSASGREALRALLRQHGHTIVLRVPRKYSMFFGLHCADRCDSRIELDRYLVDISIGQDFYADIDDEKPQPGQAAPISPTAPRSHR